LSEVAEIDFVVKAPDGKEVEEITKKEIHKALRGKVSTEQAKHDIKEVPKRNGFVKKPYVKPMGRPVSRPIPPRPAVTRPVVTRPTQVSVEQKKKFKELLDDLVGTRGAYILDSQMNILGKVPATELPTTIRSLKGIFAVIFDGSITKELSSMAERASIRYIVGMDSKIKPSETRVSILTSNYFKA